MARLALVLLGCSASLTAWAAPNVVTVHSDEAGHQLLLDGEPYFVRGMNWGYVPIGENYSYDFWGHPDEFVEKALREEMEALRRAGINSIRQYPGIPPRWVTWIYENYGITTMINPLTGRYGVTVEGSFVPVVDYSNPAHRAAIKAETMAAVETYKDVEGVLFILLGNENNYGLVWKSFEIEALPAEEQNNARAVHLYTLWGELVDEIHKVDKAHPVAICNGDLQYIDLIKEHIPNLDIMGSNVYRGASSRDLFSRVEEELGLPFVYAEFGADAYDAARGREDGLAQARYLAAQWQEIYEQTSGKGNVGNAIGGYTFQWSDGWWKYLQEENLDVHDTNASWPNSGYPSDFVEGRNNMNEEWFGINAKSPNRPDGTFQLTPRASVFMLREAYRLDPYAPGVGLDEIRAHFNTIDVEALDSQAMGGIVAMRVEELSRVTLTELRLEMSTFVAGGTDAQGNLVPTFDHMESFWLGARANPTQDVTADMRLSILGNVPGNRIDNLFWEAAGAERFAEDNEEATADLGALERVRVHDAGYTWETPAFTMKGYYRQGHFHWGYEGDFFGLYREAFYGPNPDIYQAAVPIGMEIEGKNGLDGVKLALGPQVYWGANPTVIAKVREAVGPFTMTLMHQEDVAQQPVATNTFAVPEPVSRKTTLVLETGSNGNGLTLGGIFAGSNRLGWDYRQLQPAAGADSYADSGFDLLQDEIQWIDTLGWRAKLAGSMGPVNAYVQGGIQGLVADGGPDQTYTYTGWSLKQSGRGNQMAALGGLTVSAGNLQIAPSALWQKPLVGPLSTVDGQVDTANDFYEPGIVARDVISDPFAVLDNRETTAFELLLVWDPTPGSWKWMYDNFVREDAAISGALDFVYRIQPTTTDAKIGFLADGTQFSFQAAPPPQDLWELSGHLHLRPRGDLRLRLQGYGGTAQATGSDPRLVTRYGGTLTGWWNRTALETTVKIDDWGPYDYHRDYNLTFPFQGIADLSTSWAQPRLDRSQPRIGLRAQYRTLDEHSPDGELLPGMEGVELEIGTYAFIGI